MKQKSHYQSNNETDKDHETLSHQRKSSHKVTDKENSSAAPPHAGLRRKKAERSSQNSSRSGMSLNLKDQ
jgi:hypothetical protein